jgi:alpha-ketoglutarate-dependent taurine dioxygenase
MTTMLKQEPTGLPCPFESGNTAAYDAWRANKLDRYPVNAEELIVEIADPKHLTAHELSALQAVINKTNVAIYRCVGNAMTKGDVRALGQQLGLERLDSNLCADEDSITSLQVMDTGRKGGYIPYTNKRLSWHTDGYYNPLERQVRAIVMHCAAPAASGGENMLLDHEILYLHLRDSNPDYISSLMAPSCMTIPPNTEGGEEIRGETVGPVFSLDVNANLHMRYSARTRNIAWHDDATTHAAAEAITAFLNSDSPFIFRYRLNANEGVISNNVLHNRTAFEEDAEHKRLLYRARYFDRIAPTNVKD